MNNLDLIASELPEYEMPVGTVNDTPFYCRKTYVTESSADAKGFISLPHWHENVEMLYVIDGNMVYFSQGRIINLQKGDFILVQTCEVHAALMEPGTSCEYILVKFHPDVLLSAAREAYDFRYVTPVIKNMGLDIKLNFNAGLFPDSSPGSELHCMHDMHYLMNEAYTAYSSKRSAYEFRIKAFIHMIILKVIEVNEKILPKASGVFADSELKSRALKDLLNFVKENYMDNISSHDAVKICNMSYSYFARFMKKETGVTFTEYLTSVRLSYAEKHLLLSEDTVSAIAEKCGFTDAAYFIKVFRKKYGTTPNKFRRLTEQCIKPQMKNA